jgi:LysM repeat protein
MIIICLTVFALFPVNHSPAQASGTCNGVLHTVQIGENLYRISLAYHVPMDVIASANGITNYSLIYAGSVLCIPGGTSYPTITTNTYPGVVVIPVTVTYPTYPANYPAYPTYPSYPAYPSYPTYPSVSYPTSGPYFRPCILGVECRPDQTQYMYVNGREICVAAKYTANGLGWVETDRIWCNWIDVFRAANPTP